MNDVSTANQVFAQIGGQNVGLPENNSFNFEDVELTLSTGEQVTNKQANFQVVVRSIGTTRMMTNSGQPYYVGAVDYLNIRGEHKQASALFYERNLYPQVIKDGVPQVDSMERKIVDTTQPRLINIGEAYLATISIATNLPDSDPNKTTITVGSLQGTNARASVDDFGFATAGTAKVENV